MKNNIKIILILLLSIIFISCDNESYAQETEQVETTVTKNRLPEHFIGEYKNHYGEDVTGTISITKDSIIITTSAINYNIDINSPYIKLRPWCHDGILDIIFVECHKTTILRISHWDNITGQGADLTISKDYNIIGNFDFISNETIEVPVEEPIKEIPVNNNN